MRIQIPIDPPAVCPPRATILAQQGLPAGVALGARVQSALERAERLLAEHVHPVGMLAEISRESFGTVYRGAGRNASETPLAAIYPRAAALALFVVTIGPAVGGAIERLFAERDFPTASFLDAAASEATERAAQIVEDTWRDHLREQEQWRPETRLLRYSPGYCGWHVSGQRALFTTLRPEEEIGVTLRESFLMEPLKSISGVIVAGPSAIHDFVNDYPFCSACATRECRERIRRVRGEEAP